MSLRDVPLKDRYRGPEDKPVDTFLLPMLQVSVAYDRAAGYFSSTSLAAAAVGLEPFLAARGHIRLVVNHHLSDDDVKSIEQGLKLRDVLASRVTRTALTVDGDDPEQPYRLRLLCSLVALGQLELKVAVPCRDDGTAQPAGETTTIHHAKFGVFTDTDGNRVAFEGSTNETRSGWLSNYETFSTYASWAPDIWSRYGQEVADDFARHWKGPPPAGWIVIDLPDAARDGLIAKADVDMVRQALAEQGRQEEIDAVIGRILSARGEQPDVHAVLDDVAALLAAPVGLQGVGVGSVVVDPWPHQFDVARKIVAAWPCSAMCSDEVGLGKTIEIGLVVRELLVSERVKRVLLLVPASVMWQWQTELWEKFTLAVPVLDGTRLVWPEGASPDGIAAEQPLSGNRWDAADVMLASSHLARRGQERQHLIDRRWDLVVVDEAHHARRRGSKPTKDDPNALLQLLRRMRDGDCWDGLLLASATPMQMHPHEAYDLLALLGLPGPDPEYPEEISWAGAGAVGFTRYYDQLTIEDPEHRDWSHLRGLARSQHAVAPHANPHLQAAVEEATRTTTMSKANAKAIVRFTHEIGDRKYRRFDPVALGWLDAWLREHTPMRTMVYRNTRHLLRAYQDSGIISADVIIPRRKVEDLTVVFNDEEQELYDRIETWISEKYQQVQTAAAAGDRKARATGFIMTVYRRRLTSSFRAIELSLQKRRDKLTARQDGLVDLAALLDADDRTAIEDVPDGLEGLLDDDGGTDMLTDALIGTSCELEELDSFIDALASRTSYDSKLQVLIDDLRHQFGTSKPDGHPRQAIVFTQFTDTMRALREELASLWPGQVACYSGDGGEIHNPDTGTWTKIPKSTLKTAFRDGTYRLLLGTDAMSEGLNLQTCDLLYNLDLPWNFMRVEQRIGRIDRIGGHPVVTVVNLLIDGTVEERIYNGIKDDFGDFESIVGAAQPVLAQTEEAIREAAMAVGPNRDALLAQQAQALITAAKDAASAPVSLDTFQATPDAWRPASPLPGETHDGTDWLDRLRDTFTGHPILGERFQQTEDGLWRYDDDRGRRWTVTFDRKIADDSAGKISLLVWGHPAFPRS